MLDPTLLSATWCIEVSRVQKKYTLSSFLHTTCTLQRSSWTHQTDQSVFGGCLSFSTMKNIFIGWIFQNHEIWRKRTFLGWNRARVVMKVCQCQFAGWGWGQARKQDVQGARLHPVNTWVVFFKSLYVDVQLDIRSATGHLDATWPTHGPQQAGARRSPSVVCGYILFLDWAMCPSYILKSYQQGK